MKRIIILILVLTGCSDLIAQNQPNIIYIIVDDQGWGDIGYNDKGLYTPVLDRLAEQNTRLDYHYVHPQCTPTRVALLTGRYPQRFGTQATFAGSNDQAIPYGTPTIASLLKTQGYETALIGKWHLGSVPSQGPNHWGFDYSYGCLAGGCGNYDHLYKFAPNNPYSHTWHRNEELIADSESGDYLEEGKHTTDLITKDAISFITKKHKNAFFLYLAYTAPHTPLDEEEKWFHDPDGKIMKIQHSGRRLFAAVLHHLDNSIGQVMSALEASGNSNNTIVVYSSDNGGIDRRIENTNGMLEKGYSSNGKLRSGKTHVYEGGIRVPAWIRWPGNLKKGIVKTPMHIADWLPTLCKIAGVKDLPDNLDGQNVMPMLQGESMKERNFYWAWGKEYPQPRQSIRQGEWKLVQDQNSIDWELYHVIDDSQEKKDLAKEHPEKVQNLLKVLENEMEKDLKGRMPSIED
ncbi:MAG: sulfatase-like hydrolase/transferase [Maribacter sp.]